MKQSPPLATKVAAQRYWTSSPNALRHGEGEPGSRAFYDNLARQRYAAEPCIEEIARFDERRGARLLEVGCGLGVDLVRFAKAGASVSAVDFSRSAVPIARAHLRAHGLEGDVMHGDAERLPFADGSFDFIWSHGVIHHSPNPRASAAEIYRVLAPGGKAIVMVYHRNSWLFRALVPWVLRPLVLAGLGLRKAFGRGALRLFPKRTHRVVEALVKSGYSYEKLLALATDPETKTPEISNPLSLFFTRKEGTALFPAEADARTDVRQLYHFPAPRAIASRLSRRWGVFLYVTVRKPGGP